MITDYRPPIDGAAADRLYAIAVQIHAIARRLPAPAGLEPGPCTPIEIDVMRFLSDNPGASAGVTATAVGLPTSNFSRILKGLVAKQLVRREADATDARVAHLYPTPRAARNGQLMRDAWSDALSGVLPDPGAIAALETALEQIDLHLAGQGDHS